jgi:hypothetical protein
MTNDCCTHGAGHKHAVTVVGRLERPLYTPGLILQDSDLTAAVDYTRELNRLLFSQLFGCGVICGLTVSVDTDCDLQVTVDPGLALDGCGDPLQLTKPVTIKLGRGDGVLVKDGEGSPRQAKFWVMLCGRDKPCAPRATVCDGDDFDAVRAATRARAQTEVSISFDRPHCVCECQSLPSGQADDPDYYRNFVNGLLPPDNTRGNDGHPPVPSVINCHEDHETRVACAKDCGCDSACSCGCCVLLALVYWFEPEGAWGVVHKGVRRFIRPKLLPDPISDARPKVRAQPAAGAPSEGGVPRPTPGANTTADIAGTAAPAQRRGRSPATGNA